MSSEHKHEEEEKPLQLTVEQEEALKYMKMGKNIFLTGPAGCGKTFVLNQYIDFIEEENSVLPKNMRKIINKTSTTGISAINIGGQTIHSFAGIGLGRGDVQTLLRKIKRKPEAIARWKNTRILIIDEVSMLSAELFDKLEEIARKIRNIEMPFGNIQIILSGDFAQLPIIERGASMCFESKNWDTILDKIFYFEEIKRQTDKHFQSILNKVRLGIFDGDVAEAIISRKGIYNELEINTKDNYDNDDAGGFSNLQKNKNNKEEDGDENKNIKIKPTILFSRKYMVDNENKKQYKALVDEGNRTIEYKADMFIENKYQKRPPDMKVVRLNDNYWKNMENYTIAPKKLNLVIGAQVVVIKNIFNLGLVNGSRGVVIGFTSNREPLVEFMDKRTIVIHKERWEVKLPSIEKTIKIFKQTEVIHRKLYIQQLPLKLAFALSIHKSQGMTLDYVRTNIGNSIFSTGQVYTVLSRVRSLENLYIDDFDPSKIRINPKVKKFYRELSKKNKKKKKK
jgi:ATP-dependent DNA helicase PIF1